MGFGFRVLPHKPCPVLGGSWVHTRVLITPLASTQWPYFGVDPGETSIYLVGTSSYGRNPEPTKVLKYSTPDPEAVQGWRFMVLIEVAFIEMNHEVP